MKNYFAALALDILSFVKDASNVGAADARGLIHLCADAAQECDGKPNVGKMGVIIHLAVDLLNAAEAGDRDETVDCALELRSYCFDLLARKAV